MMTPNHQGALLTDRGISDIEVLQDRASDRFALADAMLPPRPLTSCHAQGQSLSDGHGPVINPVRVPYGVAST